MVFIDPVSFAMLVVAAVVGLAVPNHIELASPTAARALRLGAAALALRAALVAINIFVGFHLSQIMVPLSALLLGAFWTSFAVAAWKLVADSQGQGGA